MLSWPKCRCITGKGMLAAIIHDAHVCRRSCTRGLFPNPLAWAFATAGSHTFCPQPFTRTGLPCVFVNTHW